MGDKTSIEWTATVNPDGSVTPGATWNPVTGCSKVSPGCAHCYAETVAHRFWPQQYIHTVERGLISAREYRGERMTGTLRKFTDVMCHEDRLDQPLRWRRPRRVFVNSMSDLFHEDVPDEFIGRVFETMACARQHVFQILTKRADRMRDFMLRYSADGGPLGPIAHNFPHVWLGVSVENQHWADVRIPLLLQTPSPVRFISAEPLLGDIDLERVENTQNLAEGQRYIHALKGYVWDVFSADHYDVCSIHGQIDWVIVGGESGPDARPMCLSWVRNIVHDCREAGVPVFVKQLGAQPYETTDDDGADGLCRWPIGERLTLRNKKGGDWFEWPTALRVREFPAERSQA